MGTAEKELLFCDTFNHEGNEVWTLTKNPWTPEYWAWFPIKAQRVTYPTLCPPSSHHIVLQELHVDLIRFGVPVVIREVRVVARDQRIPIKIEQIDFDRFGSVSVSVVPLYCMENL